MRSRSTSASRGRPRSSWRRRASTCTPGFRGRPMGTWSPISLRSAILTARIRSEAVATMRHKGPASQAPTRWWAVENSDTIRDTSSRRRGLTSRIRRPSMNKPVAPPAAIRGEEHWAQKGEVRLFLWEKFADPGGPAGIILFVHGSSMASQPTFDLHVPGRPDSSVMEWFAARGYDCWCVDMEGYGRSAKDRDNNAPISQGADDCLAAATYIRKLRGERPLLVYGISSGALRAALLAERHPDLVKRLALDAMVWTGEGSPTLAERRKKLPEFQSKNRRPIDRAFVHSIFDRDHAGTADKAVVEAFADEVLRLDDSVPTGTYVQ